MADKHALVIGGGIAGITAALELVRFGLHVDIVEKNSVPGGHAGTFACKAVEQCVRCGACMVVEKTRMALAEPGIRFRLNSSVTAVSNETGLAASICGPDGRSEDVRTDALVVATGFKPFNPVKKPFGYGRFNNVITNLELETMLREAGRVKRPSDGATPGKIAFIQCVGSRDESENHLWCSKVCCGSSLRMARSIKAKQAEIENTFFYIDVQTFCKNFQVYYDTTQKMTRMIRAIPGDIFNRDGDRLELSYFDPAEEKTMDELFDLVVLSVGITPGEETGDVLSLLGLEPESTGFAGNGGNGVFVTGTARGPMSIADTVADAGKTAFEISQYLK